MAVKGRDSVVIIPTYNEAQNVVLLVPRVIAHPAFDVVVIDDHSPDGTGELADTLARRFPGRVTVLHRPHKQGLGTALLRGFRYGLGAGYDCIFQMDADLSHDPKSLLEMRRALDRADVVIASRYLPGGAVVNRPPWRRLLSRAASAYVRALLRLPVSDPMGGYKGFRREVLEGVDLAAVRSRGYAIQAEMSYRCLHNGYRIAELPTVFTDRIHGRSKMTGAVVIEALLLPFALRVSQPAAIVRSAADPAVTTPPPGP